MKKLNFWGLVSLAISIIRLWKDHRDELQEIFEDLKELVKGLREGVYSKGDVTVLKDVKIGNGNVKKSVKVWL